MDCKSVLFFSLLQTNKDKAASSSSVALTVDLLLVLFGYRTVQLTYTHKLKINKCLQRQETAAKC